MSSVVRVRLTDSELDKIDLAWPIEGFKSRSAFIRYSALWVIGEPSSTPSAIGAMRSSSKELASIGRNINQFVKEMHMRKKAGIGFDLDMSLNADDIEALRQEVDVLKALMKPYIANSRRYR